MKAAIELLTKSTLCCADKDVAHCVMLRESGCVSVQVIASATGLNYRTVRRSVRRLLSSFVLVKDTTSSALKINRNLRQWQIPLRGAEAPAGASSQPEAPPLPGMQAPKPRNKLLSILSMEQGSTAEKEAWLESEMPLLVEESKRKDRRGSLTTLAIRYYRTYLRGPRKYLTSEQEASVDAALRAMAEAEGQEP